MVVGHVIPELDRKGLRQFGLITGAIVAGLFGILFPWLFERAWPLWPWIVLVVLGSLGLAVPEVLKPIHRAWMKFGLLVSRVTMPLLLGFVFFLLISPMALVRKFMGHDAMAREFDKNASTYRVTSEQKPAQTLEKPF